MTARFRSKNIVDRAAFGGALRLVTVLLLVNGVGHARAAAQAPVPAQAPVSPATPVAKATGSATAPASVGKPSGSATVPAAGVAKAPGVPGVEVPPDYVIGPDDQLSIVFWRDKDMSSDVAVRPDGQISLPLLNDVQAAGLTPTQLRDRLMEASRNFVEDANITVVVKQINSRKVFITGEVGKPGPYAISGPTTVLQLIAMAGGVAEYAHTKKIVIMRTDHGRPVSFAFNYDEVIQRKNLKQNIELKPGDTIIVP